MSSANLVAESHQTRSNKRVLSAGQPGACEYVTLLQSLQRVILSIHWYITQNFYPTFFMSVLVRRLFRTAIFSTFSKVAIVTANFMTDFYNSRFAIEISVSTFKETIALVPDYVSETR